jgi:hypothetical protein
MNSVRRQEITVRTIAGYARRSLECDGGRGRAFDYGSPIGASPAAVQAMSREPGSTRDDV